MQPLADNAFARMVRSVPVQDYRIFFLDEDGRIKYARSFFAPNDDEAIEEAKRHLDSMDLELWCLTRRVIALQRKTTK